MAFKFFKKDKKKQAGIKKDTASTRQEPAETESSERDAADENQSQFVDQGDAAPAVPPEEKTTFPPLPPPSSSETKPGGGFYKRLRNGLSKTRDFLNTDVNEIFSSKQEIDEDTLDDLEELLVTSDIGIQPAMELIESLGKEKSEIQTVDHLKTKLKEKILTYLVEDGTPDENASMAAAVIKPYIIMVVGVNGVGKTTTIGKLAARYLAEGKKVLLVAADTFRAAAIDQLSIWADRTGADIVKHKENSDPAAVAYDGIEAAMARGTDVVLIDTAGRLHTKVNLMAELQKIKRTITKKIPDAPHEVLLVLDATTGQNALSQARQFTDATDVTGISLTKLDGTAKGGIVVNLCHTLNIPLKYIGVGEQIDDLQTFDPVQFVDALF